MLELTSNRNSFLRRIRRAIAAGRPTDDGLVIAEGPHLLEEARSGRWRIEQILASGDVLERHRELLSGTEAEVIKVAADAFSAIADTQATQGIISLVRPPTWSWVDLLPESALVLILDSVQDPGNAGTMVRSAEAFGASGVVLVQGSARVANGKFMRATAGSIFRLPYLESISAGAVKRELMERRFRTYALAPNAPKSILQADLAQACAMVVGNEGRGLSDDWKAGTDLVFVPTQKVESLNAAVACSVGLFEAQRQRMHYESV